MATITPKAIRIPATTDSKVQIGSDMVTPVSGTNYSYSQSDIADAKIIFRSNSNVDMSDTIPFLNDGEFTVYNNDSLALLLVKSAVALDGSPSGWVLLGPYQAAKFAVRDGAAYTISQERCRPRRPTTRWYVRNFGTGHSDGNCGVSDAEAFTNPCSAYDVLRKRIDANNTGMEFYLRWDGTSLQTDYSSLLATYTFPSLPHDFGITLLGETDVNGSVRCRLVNSTWGALHVAGGCQVYAKDVAFQSSNGAPNVIAPYDGFINLHNVVCYGTGGIAPVIVAGPNKGYVTTTGPIWLNPPGGNFATAIFQAHDHSSIVPQYQSLVYSYGAVQITPSGGCAVVAVSNGGKVNAINTWAGVYNGPAYYGTSGGIITGASAIPGTPGVQDGTCVIQ